ncbi:hypothetical protein ACI2KH_14635 [Roseomonas mucosa]|uniref:hypothetical protein n=1 Tax=Roseomonas mucosa TaxID=207340 RepID=UPI00384B5921
MVWALMHLVLGLPLNRFLVPPAPPPAKTAAPGVAGGPAPWAMIVLAGVFAATLFVSAALAAHLPRLLQAAGATPAAAVAAAALLGPAQVAARLADYGAQRHLSALASARIATALHPLGALALAALGAPAAAAFALLHGAGNGMLTVAKGVLPLTLFGAAGYGLRTGVLSAPGRVLQAAAPLLFGIVLDRFGVVAALLVSGGLSVAALSGLLILRVSAHVKGCKSA